MKINPIDSVKKTLQKHVEQDCPELDIILDMIVQLQEAKAYKTKLKNVYLILLKKGIGFLWDIDKEEIYKEIDDLYE